MNSNHNLRFVKIPLNFGTGTIPALGFGTLIPDLAETKSATTNALRVGFRHLDCAERYRDEREVGESLSAEFATGAIAREEAWIPVETEANPGPRKPRNQLNKLGGSESD